ncbi:MAG: hypothetical protein MUQ65_03480 [Armatimonadetes bacterium]|nr:hypothetical protein [Armatimonadota bacterium]
MVTIVSSGLAAGGAILLVAATAWAVRPRRRSEKAEEAAPGAAAARSFAWIVIAGLAYSLLALAAAVRAPETDGLRASILQLLAVLLAGGLGYVAMSGASDENGGRSPLASAAVFAAWLSLVGLPPAVGFHGKVLVYRALLAAGWEWLAIIAVAGTAAALIPAFWALSSYRSGPLRGLRAVLAVALLIAVVLLGLYPQVGLLAAAPLAGLASGG